MSINGECIYIFQFLLHADEVMYMKEKKASHSKIIIITFNLHNYYYYDNS